MPARDHLPLEFEPENELGVILLFGKLAADRFGVQIREVSPGFPDCLAVHDGKPIRIEFEYRSRSFLSHGHDPKNCDWIVCWIHDWSTCPRRIRVVELRKEFGLGFSVWVVPIAGEYCEMISSANADEKPWSAPKHANAGDLVLFYRTSPDMFIKDIFTIEQPERVRAEWKKGKDWMAKLRRRIASLDRPITLADLRSHEVLRNAGFVRAGFRTRYRATAYWPNLRTLILLRNPELDRALKRFAI